MAAGPITQISDVVVPEVFTEYVMQRTAEKARIIQSGIAQENPALNAMLAGGGITFNIPSFRDLDNDTDRISTDTAGMEFVTNGPDTPDPQKIQTSQEVAVRLSRNNSWSSADLTAALAGEDPMAAIGDKVAFYWTRRFQAAFVASVNGIIADNAAAPSGSEHVQNDLINNISGASFVDGTTNFSAEAFIDTALTMGDSMEDLTAVIVHSVVYARMQKNNLIDFVPDSTGLVQIPTFLGREVIVDDGMPRTGNVYDTWLFGRGFSQLGVGTPINPTEVHRLPGAGNGSGQEVLYSRLEWMIHPVGHAFVAGTIANGGPDNTANSNMLANAGSWQRRYPERKQIPFARLVTREA